MMIPRWLHRRLEAWAKRKVRQRPDEMIERDGLRYLDRWHIVRTPFFRVYLHRFRRPDQDWELHDHPFAFVSVGLRGMYDEEVGFDGSLHLPRPGQPSQRQRKVIYRRASLPHRIMRLWGYYVNGEANEHWGPLRPPKPVTLVITGPKFRSWGFFCDDGRRISKAEHERGDCYLKAAECNTKSD